MATFVSLSIIGGALIQYPLGYISDRKDRRYVLLTTSVLALAAALALSLLAGSDRLLNFGIVFVFGSFAMPLYSLSAAHANDRAAANEFVMVNAGLMLFYSFGAIGGPFAAANVMSWFGPHALFMFSAAVYAVFILVIFYRMRARPAVPRAQARPFPHHAQNLAAVRPAGAHAAAATAGCGGTTKRHPSTRRRKSPKKSRCS